MSLTASAIGLDKAALTLLVGASSLVDEYAQHSDANITIVLTRAADAFRSAAIKGGYSSTSVDALTSTTTPESVKGWLLHWALDELTSGGMSRPDSIATFGTEARKWLSRLAAGVETIDGLSRETATGGAQIRANAPTELVFDRCNTSQNFNWRDRRI